MEFPNKKFNVILADPPWSYRDKADSGKRGAGHKYPCMSLSDLMQLPINRIAADDCVLFMWHVPVMPLEALKLVESWGFKLTTMKGFTWVKLYQGFAQTMKKRLADDLPGMTDEQIQEAILKITKMGMGNHTRGNTEDCLIAVRGKNYERLDASIKQVVYAPFTRHSEKPAEVRDLITRLVGDVPRIELFARQRAPGWDAWGNEL